MEDSEQKEGSKRRAIDIVASIYAKKYEVYANMEDLVARETFIKSVPTPEEHRKWMHEVCECLDDDETEVFLDTEIKIFLNMSSELINDERVTAKDAIGLIEVSNQAGFKW